MCSGANVLKQLQDRLKPRNQGLLASSKLVNGSKNGRIHGFWGRTISVVPRYHVYNCPKGGKHADYEVKKKTFEK